MLLALLGLGNQQLPKTPGAKHPLPRPRSQRERNLLVGNLLELHRQNGRTAARRAPQENAVARGSHLDRQLVFVAGALVREHTLTVFVADAEGLLSRSPPGAAVERADVGQSGAVEGNPAVDNVTPQPILDYVAQLLGVCRARPRQPE